MKVCIPNLLGLTRNALEAIAAGETDAPECEVEGAIYLLTRTDKGCTFPSAVPHTTEETGT